jgi:hypothetical protein
MVEEKELRIIHYTLGPLKPWDWYTAWLIKPVEVWQVTRSTTFAAFFVAFSAIIGCNQVLLCVGNSQ